MSTISPAAMPTNPGQGDGREVEWQMACTDLPTVNRWLIEHGTIGGLVIEPRPAVQIFDTYFDTEDWRINRAGFALRIRSASKKSEATLKSLHSASTEVADRRELNESLENFASESIRNSIGPVGTRVRAVSGARPLRPLFEVRTSRRRFAIRRADEQQQMGEIALDETVIARPRGEPQTSMQRVEVEALTEAHEPLHSLVRTLRSDCTLELASESKYSQGLKSVGLVPQRAPEFEPTVIDASMTIARVALASLRRHLSAWHRHEPGARLGDEPEELHALRVAGRRIEAILRQFRSSLPESLLRIRPTFKTILRALGHARDLDVALAELEAFSGTTPKPDRASVEPLKQHLLSERTRARARMVSVLDSFWVQTSLQELTALLTDPLAIAEQDSSELAVNVSPLLIRRRYRKLRKGADQLTSDSPIEAYHAVRAQVKRLRYMLEAVAVIYGKPADRLLSALRLWQERLGLQQDYAVACRRLQDLADSSPQVLPPETLFLMGRLAEHHAGAASRARNGQLKGYRRIRRRWKKLRIEFAGSSAGNAMMTCDSGK